MDFQYGDTQQVQQISTMPNSVSGEDQDPFSYAVPAPIAIDVFLAL
jgi:hypothetical protein